jgi:asparagine synthase (glutamine-hydrolysing)
MLDQIQHRGPDDYGVHVDRGCGIGMRRLSIIDLSTGHQPIPNEDESCWIVFNGEIYNYQDLQDLLRQQGHRFRTQSDTETILHLYEQEGPECLQRLRGMFGLAIWDARREELFLARDRFGKKPLYYSILPHGLYFGSEIKSLRAAGVPLELDAEALKLYFQFSYVPDPASPFRAIRKLAPGGWLRYRVADGSVEQGRYWKLPPPQDKEPQGFDGPALVEELKNRFDEAVRLRLVADVPLGAFLSGGIDSSLVVASMARQTSRPVKTFSIGFEEADFDELPYARMVARQYNTDHHEIVVRPDSAGLAHKIVRHFDEPFGDTSAIPTYMLSEFTVQHVKVALSGDGGDELFGGYTRFAEIPALERWRALPGLARSVGGWLAGALPYAAYGKNYLHTITRATPLERYFGRNYAPYQLRRQLLRPEWMLPEGGEYLRRAFPDLLPESADAVSQAEYWEAVINLPGDMLVKVDRMSMANSLEVRCPLLDQEVAAVAARFPHSWRIRGGQKKYPLLAALGDRLPPGLANRPKMGFGVPIAKWFRGELAPLLQEYLLGKRFLERGIVSEPFVRALIGEHAAQRRDNSQWLWNLLMLELWFRDYFG